jgi:hypothetical protein
MTVREKFQAFFVRFLRRQRRDRTDYFVQSEIG